MKKNSLYKIDNDRVVVGGQNSFSIVNIDKCVIEKTIKDDSLGAVYCFTKLRDKKTIICGCDYGYLCLYDMKTEEYRKILNNNQYAIIDLLIIDESIFLSCSVDIAIKSWKYYYVNNQIK